MFIDYGSHGSWNAEAADVPCRVLIDGEPGYRQILMHQAADAGEPIPEYDHYFTNGLHIGTNASSAPTAGLEWGHLFHPVDVRSYQPAPPPADVDVTISYDSFVDYVASSLGEFAVCKQVFVALHTGWFSDRSAAYLASGRPVVLQDTGSATTCRWEQVSSRSTPRTKRPLRSKSSAEISTSMLGVLERSPRSSSTPQW